jgi:predicted O-methyltransferase YrrM
MDLENISSRDELIKIIKPTGNGIEIGVQGGNFASHILKHCNNLKLYLLDCWDNQDDSLYQDIANHDNETQVKCMIKTIRNTSNSFKNVRIIKGYSDEFVDLFKNDFFDFIYIDANHTYEAIKHDINKWFPKIKNGGLFAGHDYFDGVNKNGVFKVKTAVDEFVKENNLKVYSTKEPNEYKSWFIIK